MTKLIKCNCKHEFQDNKYHGMRVANKTSKLKGSEPLYRCTVCSKETT